MKYLYSIILCIALFCSCNKLIEVESPVTSVTGDNVFKNDRTAIAVLTSLYAQISGNSFTSTTGISSITRLAGLSADELSLWSGNSNITLAGYYKNQLSSTETLSIGAEMWNACYKQIYTCNSVIENIQFPNELTEAVRRQLLGEAKFMRAFNYYFLTNLYGDVPLVLSTDYSSNRLLPRSPSIDIYKQMINDLKDAFDMLSSDYLDGTLLRSSLDRVRPTKWVAASLLARVYLYTNDWVNAENQATILVNKKDLYDTVSLNSVFLKASSGNKEAIWQLQPVNINWNTEDARSFIFTTPNFSSSTPYSLSPSILNNFEPGDQRAVNGNWIKSISLSGTTYYYPYKYKIATSGTPVNEHLVIFRLAEQFLIRAEARAQQGKLSEASADLNVIRKRAGLSAANPVDKATFMTLLVRERQSELFTEWGHRWFDLKRLNLVNTVMANMTPQKGGSWEVSDALYPLPIGDILKNTALIQNPGY